MKVTSLLTAALLPMGLMGAPIADEAADVVARESVDVSPNEPAVGLLAATWCSTVGASEIKCRAGPGTNYQVETTISKGRMGVYTCVKTGECVNIGGKINCGWHFNRDAGYNGCYVSGHYTDSACTLASLGRC